MATNRIPRQIASRRLRQRSLLTAVLTSVLILVGGTAWAYWAATGTGSGLATTGTLLPPTNVLASNTTGSTSVSVSWTAPTSGSSPSGYYVRRSINGISAPACGTSATTPTTGLSCTDAGLADGTYTYVVTAVRGSWTAASTPSPAITVTSVIATSTVVTSSPNPSSTGQAVTYTATVSPASGSVAPTGSVVFRDGSTTITCSGGVQTLNAGTATCSTTYATAGTHSITAAYQGSTAFSASTSAAISQVVNAAVVNTTTSVASSANPSVVGQAVTYTATVTPASGSTTPTGSVTFKDGAATIACAGGAQTLNASGVATCSLAYTSAGGHAITAAYTGTTGFTASTSTVLNQAVNAASTSTSLSAPAGAVKTDNTVTYTAVVSPVSPGSGTPTGTVTFKDGTNTITCSGGVQALNGSGVATCDVSYSAVGTHSISAVYNGALNFATSTSATAAVKVVQARVAGLAFTNVKLGTASANPSCTGAIGSTYTCTVANTANNASISANVVFVDANGVATVLSAVDESVSWSADGKATPNSGAVTVLGGATTSTATVAATKNGSNNVTITVTYGSWTATLKTS